MSNADKIAARIAIDEYRLNDAEALDHIMAIVNQGGEDALNQIGGILSESGRGPDAVREIETPGYDADSGEFGDYDEGDLGNIENMEGLSLLDACLDNILKPQPVSPLLKFS